MSDTPNNEESQQEQTPEKKPDSKYSSTGRLLTPGMGLEGELVQPKTVKKQITRFAILMGVLAVLFLGMKWVMENKDLGGLGSTNTSGWISALEYGEHGAQVVYIDSSGEIHKSPAYTQDATDQEPVWSPDGNRLYFVSNREIKSVPKGANNIYRWNLSKDMVEARTTGTRSKGTPIFDVNITDPKTERALLASGQTVLTFTPADSSMHQLLPPIGREMTVQDSNSDGASSSAFEQSYSRYGQSFRKAEISNDGTTVLAIMRREDGEVLIAQDISQGSLPVVVATAQYLDIEKNPVTGEFYVLIHDFYIPFEQQIPKEYIKNGKVTYPYRHAIQRLTMGEKGVPQKVEQLFVTNDDKMVFGSMSTSPDGQYLLITAGEMKHAGMVKTSFMGIVPLAPGSPPQPVSILNQEVFEPSWSPDSSKIVYVKMSNGKRDIFTISRDGSGETNITNGKGDFGFPAISPQIPK